MRILFVPISSIALGAFAILASPMSVANAANEEPPVASEESSAPASIVGMSDQKLSASIERWIANYYLSGHDLSREEMKAIYAPTVDYFGKGEKSLSYIIRDQRGYYRRWPQRMFEMVPGTLQIARDPYNKSVVDVSFQYDFETRSARRTSRGRGLAELTLDFSLPGGRIVREGGRVLERY